MLYRKNAKEKLKYIYTLFDRKFSHIAKSNKKQKIFFLRIVNILQKKVKNKRIKEKKRMRQVKHKDFIFLLDRYY